jgi:hypothetical protein
MMRRFLEETIAQNVAQYAFRFVSLWTINLRLFKKLPKVNNWPNGENSSPNQVTLLSNVRRQKKAPGWKIGPPGANPTSAIYKRQRCKLLQLTNSAVRFIIFVHLLYYFYIL